MREAPDLLSDPPESSKQTIMDPTLDIVGTTHLTGGIFLDAEFTAPWCITARIGPEDCVPFTPAPGNIIAYHYISAGRLLLRVGNDPPVAAHGGDLVVLPRNDPHTMGSALNLRPVRADALIQPTKDGLAHIVHGGGGERTHILCGFLGSETVDDPVLRFLPTVLKVNVAENASRGWIESSLRFAAAELTAGRIKSPTVLARLAELLFLEAVRQYVASLPPDQTGWMGMRDPMIGRALALIHGRIARRWTAGALAREIGMSRSAFADRFARVMGEPPMRYLAQQRLQAAARRLEASTDSLARIAFQVGYESEAAFNRAFKREFGVPPASWRRDRLGRSAVRGS
jgi:AraC-like DNA-binding protein